MSPAVRATDLLVLGTGAAGMTAALTGAMLGLDVLVLEKSARIGGTTALSAGSLWVPNSRHSPPGEDSFDQALLYLRNAVGNRLDEALARAFLASAPAMIDFLEKDDAIAFRAYPHHPDYLAKLPGATSSGRALEPLPFDASVLGRDFARLRPPMPEFTLLGGMMVDRTDIGHLLNAARSPRSLRHGLKLLARYGLDRMRFARGTRLVMGNALAGRLFHALRRRGVDILTETSCRSLITDEGRITGAEVEGTHGPMRVRARRGVVLATGGFSRHPELRARLLPTPAPAYSPLVESVTGDGIALGEMAGGRMAAVSGNTAFWAPVSLRARADGTTAVFPHFVLDRGKPGLIAVDALGRRFVNEATTYHRFAEAMYAAHANAPAIPCFFICDDDFIGKYGLGMVRPRRLNLRRAIADGYVTRADSLAQLAEALKLPAADLAATIARHNEFAASGVDTDFGKGGDAYQRNLGDSVHGPNPCLGPIAKAPFYAIRVYPGDIGASRGLVADEHARVLDAGGAPIHGLYVCGNDMNSIMAGTYPGPGITIGPAMVFGFIAARHAAGIN
jgi:succinate dehydrogenase/fumarate reductase flavoprotein subunit